MIVVSNTSPIIILYYAQCLDILEKLFGTVYIPPAVFDELTIHARNEQLRAAIKKCLFIKVKSLNIPIPDLQHKLDIGEIESLTLAQQLKADLLILDDKRAQKETDLLAIPYVSSFALLIKAHQKGFLPDLQQALHQLEEHQIFLNKELKDFLGLLP